MIFSYLSIKAIINIPYPKQCIDYLGLACNCMVEIPKKCNNSWLTTVFTYLTNSYQKVKPTHHKYSCPFTKPQKRNTEFRMVGTQLIDEEVNHISTDGRLTTKISTTSSHHKFCLNGSILI